MLQRVLHFASPLVKSKESRATGTGWYVSLRTPQVIRFLGGTSEGFSSSSSVRQIIQPLTRNSLPLYDVSITNHSSKDNDLIVVLFNARGNMTRKELIYEIPRSIIDYKSLITDAIESGLFEGKCKSKVVLRVPDILSNKKWKNIALIGAFDLNEDPHLSKWKDVSGHFSRGQLIGETIKETKATSVGIATLKDTESLTDKNYSYCCDLLLGIDDSLYNDTRFKAKQPDDKTASPRSIKSITFISNDQRLPQFADTLVPLIKETSSAISKGVVRGAEILYM